MWDFLKLSRQIFKTTEKGHKQIRNGCEDFVLHKVEVSSVEKIFKNIDVGKASRIDQITPKLFKEGALNSCDIRDLYCRECPLLEYSS